MSALTDSRLNSDTATLPVEVLEFLDVSACYLGREEFPWELLEKSSCPQSDVQHSDTEVKMQ